MKWALVFLLVATALLAGCTTAVPSPAPTLPPSPTPSHAPTAAPTAPMPTATPTRSDPATSTPAATATPQPTNTPTPGPTYTLSGTVFFDYNGNGLMDEREPPIEGVPIRVGALSTTSAPDGSYYLPGVPAGSQQVYVESPTQDPATSFRYISLSLEAFQPIDHPVPLTVREPTTLDIPLMQGFLTLPVPCNGVSGETKYVDLDHRLSFVRRWDGIATGPSLPDQHPGIDYHGTLQTLILAAAPGLVVVAGQDPAHTVRLVHEFGGEKFVTDYAHNDSVNVEVGDQVRRGQVIAQMGGAPDVVVHVHFELWPLPESAESSNAGVIDYVFNPERWPWVQTPSGDELPSGLDPYRDLAHTASLSYWSVDNSPQCLP